MSTTVSPTKSEAISSSQPQLNAGNQSGFARTMINNLGNRMSCAVWEGICFKMVSALDFYCVIVFGHKLELMTGYYYEDYRYRKEY